MPISVFDVIGPKMVGPSSSHTAGAVKLGNFSRHFLRDTLASVTFYLHGSFAKTYRGHGTDKALLGGVLGLRADSEMLPRAEAIARARGIRYEFKEIELEGAHPNSVRIDICDVNGNAFTVTGCSIGGGAIRITSINDIATDLSGDLSAIVTHHGDRQGLLAEVSTFLSEQGINIATVNLYRREKGRDAFMVIEIDGHIDPAIAQTMQAEIDDLIDVFIIEM